MAWKTVNKDGKTTMRPNTIKKICTSGGVALNAWSSIPAPYAAEVLGHQGVDSVTVDLQHGMAGFDTAVAIFQAISATPAIPFARVSHNNISEINKLLDAGAYGIICPMISTPQDAQRFARACRYPAQGDRSFGPARGALYGGPDYFQQANEEIISLAMIETVEGLENLDAILATEGLDGIYVGPNDLCLALGVAPNAESDARIVRDAIARIVDRCRSAGKIAGIFCSSGEAAAMRAEQGFNFVTPGNDAALLGKALRKEVADSRKSSPAQGGNNSGY